MLHDISAYKTMFGGRKNHVAGDIPSYMANPPDKPPTRPPLARAACRAGPGDQLHYVWKIMKK